MLGGVIEYALACQHQVIERFAADQPAVASCGTPKWEEFETPEMS